MHPLVAGVAQGLPSHEGSGLKFDETDESNDEIPVSPRMRGVD